MKGAGASHENSRNLPCMAPEPAKNGTRINSEQSINNQQMVIERTKSSKLQKPDQEMEGCHPWKVQYQ
jgi:hypothetical protein